MANAQKQTKSGNKSEKNAVTAAIGQIMGRIGKAAKLGSKLSSTASVFLEAMDTQAGGQAKLGAALAGVGAGAAYGQIADKAGEIQSLGMYSDEAMMAGASALTGYTSDAGAITTLMDTLANYAAGMSGGAAVDAAGMAAYGEKLGRAMQGDYSGLPWLTQAEQTAMTGGSEAEKALMLDEAVSRRWAELYEVMSGTPTGQIAQFGNTLDDLKASIGAGIYPAALNFVQLFQQDLPQVQAIVSGLAAGLSGMLVLLAGLADGAIDIGSAIVDNWSWIEPIVWGVVGALLAYNAVSGVGWITTLKGAAAMAAHAAAGLGETVAIFGMMVAQDGLNAALHSCPISWIIAGIIALVAAVTAVVRALDLFGSQGTSVLGTICGMVNIVIQFFGKLATGAIGAVFGIMAGITAMCVWVAAGFDQVKSMFYGMLSAILNGVAALCEKLNQLPFLEIDFSGITKKAEEYAEISKIAYENAHADHIGVIEAAAMGFNSVASDALSGEWAEDAFASGASFGDGLMDKFNLGSLGDQKELFSGLGDQNGTLSDLFSSFEDQDGALSDLCSLIEEGADYGDLKDRLNASAQELTQIERDTGSIAYSAGGISDSLDITREELKYLRDIAERDAINRFTTAEVKIDMTGMTNKIDSGMDLDSVLARLTDGFTEALTTAAEGVHS